jgi:TP901 family phage tail tape measure protein
VAGKSSREFEVKFIGNTTSLTKSFSTLEKSVGKVGKSLSRNVTAPLVALGAASAKLAIDFDSSMTKIVSLVGISASEVDSMRESVLKLAGDTGKAPQELADGLFVLTSAGLRGNDALSALEQSAKAGSAGLGEVNDIARAVAGAMNAYGSSTISASKATDIITATARAGNFEVSQFSAALGRVLPFAKQAGASLEDVGGAVALLTRTNGDAAQSVTQVQALLRAFVVPTAEATKALSAVGLSAEDLRNAISTDGLPAALEMLDEKLGGNREQLGRLLGSSEGASAAFQILDADAESLAGTFGVTNDAIGLTNDAFGITADTAGFKLQKSLNGLKVVGIQLGDTLVPVIEKFSDGIAVATAKLQAMSPAQRDLLVKLAGIAVVLGPALIIIGSMLGAFVNLIAVVKLVGAAVGFLAAQWTGVGVAAGGAAVATVTATTIIKRALITTGVGALIIGIGFIASKFYDAAQAANDFGDAKKRALTGQESRDVARSTGRNTSPEKTLEQQLEQLNVQMQDLGSAKAPKADKALKGLSDSAKLAQAQMSKLSAELTFNNDALTKAKDAYSSFKDGIKNVITGIVDFGSAATAETGTFLENLVAQAAKAADFGAKVKQLLAMGLSETAIAQVLSAGADAGTKIADEIIAGGATVVDQVNTLVSATQSVAEAVGEAGAQQFYQAGITAGQALVDGVKAAIAAAGFSINVDGQLVNQGAIDQVNAAIAKARTKKSKGKSKITKGERQSIMDLAASLGVEVPAFAKGGIVTGPTLALIGEAGPEAVVPLSGRNAPMGKTFNLTVNAGMGADGAAIGREIVDAIKRYERTSGPVFASA